MSKSKPLQTSLGIIGVVAVYSLAVAIIQLFIPQAKLVAHHQAEIVAHKGTMGDIDPVLAYQAAATLDSGRPTYRLQLSQAYLEAWDPAKALVVLNDSDQDMQTTLTRSKALTELDRGGEALRFSGNASELVKQRALVLAYNGSYQALAVLKAESQGRQDVLINRVQKRGVAFAQELAKAGMPQAALRVIDTSKDSSAAAAILTSEIMVSKPQPTSGDWKSTENRLDKALHDNPASLPLHSALKSVFDRQDKTKDASDQSEVIKRLKAETF